MADMDEWNEMAVRYAEINDLAYTAGSDAHHVSRSPLSGLAFSQPLGSIEDFIAAVKRRSGTVLRGVENPLTETRAAHT